MDVTINALRVNDGKLALKLQSLFLYQTGSPLILKNRNDQFRAARQLENERAKKQRFQKRKTQFFEKFGEKKRFYVKIRSFFIASNLGCLGNIKHLLKNRFRKKLARLRFKSSFFKNDKCF